MIYNLVRMHLFVGAFILLSCQHRQSSRMEVAPIVSDVVLTDVPGYSKVEIAQPAIGVIEDDPSWKKLVELFVDDRESTTSVLQSFGVIDFNHKTVLVASFGDVPCMLTNPVKLFQGAKYSADTLLIYVGLKAVAAAPKPDDVCLTAIDYLTHLVSMPRHNGPIRFVGVNGQLPPTNSLFQ